MKYMIILLLLVLAAFVPVQAHEEETAPANTMCPVLRDEPIDPAIFADYDGQRVWFCCLRCRKNFLAAPAEYLAVLPQFGGIEALAGNPHDPPDHDHTDQQHDLVEHDHATDHGQPEGISRLIRFAGRFHPLVIHFPIALIVAAALAEILGLLTHHRVFFPAARFSVALGALFAVVAVGLGWAAGAFSSYPGQTAGILTIHRWLGTAAGVLIVITAALSEISHRREGNRLSGPYRVGLFISVTLVGLAGHFGGTLIFGTEHYAW